MLRVSTHETDIALATFDNTAATGPNESIIHHAAVPPLELSGMFESLRDSFSPLYNQRPFCDSLTNPAIWTSRDSMPPDSRHTGTGKRKRSAKVRARLNK